MLIPVRRVVTTNDERGRSRVHIDDRSRHVVETRLDRGLTNLWVTDGRPDVAPTSKDAADRALVLEPPAGGTVFRFFQLAPRSSTAAMSPAEAEASAASIFAAMGASHLRPDTTRHPGMHRSPTLDYIILLRGHVRMLLDDGEVDLAPFDVVVQRGTNHAWVNLDDEPALLVAVLMDADARVS
jgi:hypothetical protein